MAPIRFLFADNDFPAGHSIRDDAGNPGTGLTVTAFVSLTKDRATAITVHSDVSVNLVETVPSSGDYDGVIQGDKITSRLLPTYKNQKLFVIWKSGTDYFAYRAVRVRDSRQVA